MGDRDGEETVQVYIGMVDLKIDRQKKLLKGFDKVAIRRGESRAVMIPVTKDDLRYFNMEKNQWVLEPGTYRILVGPHSGEQVLLEAQVRL